MKTLTKRTTHIAEIRQANTKGMHQVCHLLQWSEQQYCDFLFDQYCKFVNEKFKNHPDVIANRVLYSKYYRGVFNNAASLRDEVEFIPFAVDVVETITSVNRYGELEVLEGIPVGGSYLVDEWQLIHSYKRLLLDDDFLKQFKHALRLIKIL